MRLSYGTVLLAAACQIGPQASDAGTDAAPQTVGDQCEAIITEFCTQAINRCALAGFTLAECVDSDVKQCCTGSACNATSKSPASAVSACKAAIDVEDCNAIVNSTLPAECQGVPSS